MTPIVKATSSAALALLLLTGAAERAIAQTRPELGRVHIPYDTFTLPNGLKTLVYTDRSAPTVFVGVWYGIGSKDEPQGRSGFAHLFEHLMFQPTPDRPSPWFPPLEAVGATGINGMTTADFTQYVETVPANALDRALWMEADRMANLGRGITQSGLDEQRAVVKNEKRQGELNPGAASEAQFLKAYYPPDHPYAHTTIGSMDDLDRATLDDVKAWFENNYGASNAVLVLAGDIDVATAREKVARYFGGVRRGAPISRTLQWTPGLAEIRRDVVYENIPVAALARTWPLTNDAPRDNTLLQLAARSLANGPGTPLYDALVDRLGVATGMSAGVNEGQLTSAFTLTATLKPGVTPEAAGAAIDAAMQDFFATGPAADRLETVISASDVALLRTMENSGAIGAWLADGQVNHGDPTYFLKQREWIGAATPAEIRTLAARVLSRPYYELIQMPTAVDPVAPVADPVDPARMPDPGPAQTRIVFPPIAEAVLPNGLKLVVANRPNLPLVDARLQFRTGSLAEDAYGRGTAGRAFSLLTAGTRRYDREQLSRQASRLGVSFAAGADARESGVSWSMLKARLDDGFALAAEVVRHPSYPQSEIDKALEAVGPQFDAYERNPIAAAGPVYARAIWGDAHPYGRIGTRDDAKTVDRQAIQAFHDHEMGPNDATLYLVGDITLDEARRLAAKYFGDWRPVSATPPATLAAAAGTPGRVILVDAPGAAQSSVTVGHVVGPFNPQTSAAEALADSILGSGLNSRLNLNLREARGWTYGFDGGVSDAPTGQRVFTASGTVEAERTADAMTEIRKEIAAYVADRPATQDEVDRDRNARILALPSAFSGNGAFLSSIVGSAGYSLPYDRAASSGERLKAVTLDQVQALSRQTYHPDRLTWVVVGDLKTIEASVRALNLGPVEVWDVYGNRLR
ncbi:Peptidase M16 inactive domain protein [Brevundimonas sp. SH203]|uniref:M16 family metallopeptidase n=1 Tax=Brevundimonas sp. SH203 TaxID=345167 RepID=UPI0009CAF77A|nr:pitrilysin family protein [Brevundimonas sp. SH203]GAW39651.1 Peptidase M16 inactive domain protein [Brevundimonas sp. SH203]